VGDLLGQIKVTNSQAYVQFNAPLSKSLGNIIYSIVSQDNGTLGRVNLSPPTVNSGLSSIAGQVGVVPEPSTMVLAALGVPVLLLVAYRNRKK